MTITDQASSIECVVLLHGLGRTAASMIWLAHDLRRAGYLVVNQGYPSRKLPIPELSLHVMRAVSQCQALVNSNVLVPQPIRISFVTHSMGAILLRSYFANQPLPNNERVAFHRAVLLGPPNLGSEIVDQLKGRWYFRFSNGPAGVSLGTAPSGYLRTLPGLPMHFGVIAGVAAKQNWLLPKLPMPHDGKVTVASTHLAGQAAHLQLPVKHTWLPSHTKVRKHVIFFLRNGIFSDEIGKTD